jgi:hypothetical protein
MRLPDIIEKELAPIAGRWEVKNGGKHYKLVVDGHLVGVLPHGSGIKGGLFNRSILNIRSNIRRHLANHPC